MLRSEIFAIFFFKCPYQRYFDTIYDEQAFSALNKCNARNSLVLHKYDIKLSGRTIKLESVAFHISIQWSFYFKTTHGTKKMWSYIAGGLKVKPI